MFHWVTFSPTTFIGSLFDVVSRYLLTMVAAGDLVMAFTRRSQSGLSRRPTGDGSDDDEISNAHDDMLMQLELLYSGGS